MKKKMLFPILLLIVSGIHLSSEASYNFKYDDEALKWLTNLVTRIRREPQGSGSEDNDSKVKDALKQILPGRDLEETSDTVVDSLTTSTVPTTQESAPSVMGEYNMESTDFTDSTTELVRSLTEQIPLKADRKLIQEGTPSEYYDTRNANTTGVSPTRSKEIPQYDRMGVLGNPGVYLEDPFFPEVDKDKLGFPEIPEVARGRITAPTETEYFDTPGTQSRLTRTRTTTTRTRRSRTTPVRIDIAKLMALVSNLTMSYQEELAALLNKSLEQYTIPTCATPSTTVTTPEPTTDMYANLTGTIMGKCFVCGLTATKMPDNSHCADAFTGDFIPLVPMNPTARGHIARFRKYCRWMNIPRYYINISDSRSMWGRWTGGCSVRWIDINGMYTQRTCRNRHRAIMGRHWLSKRMAKLEMALQHEDNGCIMSPMSSLVPFSRGISLYARFHACVCTGNWCNTTSESQQWLRYVVFLLFILWTIS